MIYNSGHCEKSQIYRELFCATLLYKFTYTGNCPKNYEIRFL